jgi:hypothetical protein
MPRAIRVAALAGAMVTVLSAAPTAAAQDSGEDASKLYWGAGLGAMDFESDHGGVSYADGATGLQLYGGFQARELMAVELALDRFSGIESGEVLGSGVERLRIATQYSSVTVRGVFSLSLQEVLPRRQNIMVFGTVGLAHSTEERSVTERTAARESEATDRDDGLVLGAGVVFDVARFRLRAHYQTVDRRGPSLDSIGLAAEFRF